MRSIWRLAFVAALAATGVSCARPQAVALDGEKLRLRMLFKDDFDSLDNWINLTPATRWWTEDGRLYGHWAKGGSTLWCRRSLKGDLYVEFKARVLDPDPSWVNAKMPEGGKNLNLRFLVAGPAGEDILAVYRRLADARTGPNAVGDEKYHGYFFTWTFKHSRLRRSPGYDNVSENLEVLPALNTPYTVSVLKTGDRLRYFVDGRKIHDYRDPAPFHRGGIGFALWRSRVVIDDLRVWQVER